MQLWIPINKSTWYVFICLHGWEFISSVYIWHLLIGLMDIRYTQLSNDSVTIVFNSIFWAKNLWWEFMEICFRNVCLNPKLGIHLEYLKCVFLNLFEICNLYSHYLGYIKSGAYIRVDMATHSVHQCENPSPDFQSCNILFLARNIESISALKYVD